MTWLLLVVLSGSCERRPEQKGMSALVHSCSFDHLGHGPNPHCFSAGDSRVIVETVQSHRWEYRRRRLEAVACHRVERRWR